jgi:hypothetical protein
MYTGCPITHGIIKTRGDFAQFLTGPCSAHRPPTKMADQRMESSFHPLQA